MRTPSLGLPFALYLAASATAQVFVPAGSSQDQSELNSRLNYPLMRAASRSQFVIAANEVGAPVMLTKLALRYDGPSYGTGGGTLGTVDLYLSNNAVAPNASTAAFDTNHGGGLTQVASATGRQFPADASVNPDVFGGVGGELLFTFNQPFAYSGGNLVIEIRTSGNTNGAGAANCQLDAELDPNVGPKGGSWVANGSGCGGVTMAAQGTIAPGGEVSLSAQGFAPFGLLVAFLGTSRTVWNGIPLPFPLTAIGMEGCQLENDILIQISSVADAGGALPAYTPAMTVAIPQVGSFAGAKLQFQIIGQKPVTSLGLVATNNVEVTLGTYAPLYRGYYAHFHHQDANAAVAAASGPMCLAMRFN